MSHEGARALRRTSVVTLFALALTMVAMPTSAWSAGPGGGGGGGGGTGDLYADLVVAWRDVDGVPLLAEFTVEGETGPTTELCVQPVSYVPLPGLGDEFRVVNGADGREVYRIPLLGETGTVIAEEEEIEVCDPDPAYAMYVEEAELERLNMARQPDEVRDRKLQEVYLRLTAADEITLDSAGRLTTDGAVMDAGPDHAVIYDAIMRTGDIPGIPASPAAVGGFDAWMLAAASLGTASGKSVPVTVDAVQYYNRILAIPDEHVPSPTWELDLNETTPPNGERFVDFSGFSYTRDDLFTGCVTWLDVPSLTWKVSRVADVVEFAPLPPVAQDTDGDDVPDTVSNIAGFAQMADDVRATILYLHENEVIPGFRIDPVFVDTCDEQTAALTDPAVSWGGVPAELIQTEIVPVTTTAYLPWAASPLAAAELRITVAALDDGQTFSDGDQVTMVATSGDLVGTPVTFTVEGGELVGAFGPAGGWALAPGDQLATAFTVQVAAGGPTGPVALNLELVDAATGDTALASDVHTTQVHAAAPLALWAGAPQVAALGSYATATARVFNPDLDPALPVVTAPRLRLTVDAPTAFAADTDIKAWSDAVAMPMALDGDGNLVGEWTLPDPLPVSFDENVAWYLLVAETAPLGLYTLQVELVDSTGVRSTDVADVLVLEGVTQGPPGPPGAPIDVVAVPGDGEVTVSWRAPVTDGGSPILSYTATSDPGGVTCVTTTTTCTLEGLTNDLLYTFTVAATNSIGTGLSSPPSVPVAPHHPVCGPGVTEGPFPDVAPTHTFCLDIDWLVTQGITMGRADGTFGPAAAVSRQEMAAFLYRLADEPDGPNPVCDEGRFSDVGADNPFCGVITWMADEGITVGNPDATFGPTALVSRQAMAAFLYRFAGEPGGADAACEAAPFTDVPVDHPFCEEIAWMAGAGITTGNPDGTYQPTAVVARAAMAAFLHRLDTHLAT